MYKPRSLNGMRLEWKGHLTFVLVAVQIQEEKLL